MTDRRPSLGRVLASVAAAVALVALARPVAAHGGSLGSATRESATVPPWLLVATGGGVVSASFLLATFATDRDLVASVHASERSIPVPGRRALVLAGKAVGVAALAAVLVVGFTGPSDPLSNTAVMVVWAGWWAGFAMSTYLLGNAWPVLNPWRTVAGLIPDIGRTYRWRWGAWLSVVGLLALVWLEVVSPLADRPSILAATVAAYSVVTLAGAVVYGRETWFRRVDPVAQVFRYYGAVAPFGVAGGSSDDDRPTRSDGGVGEGVVGDDVVDESETVHGTGAATGERRLVLRVPGAGLTDDILDGLGEVALVVALLWVTTFDGLVATPAWQSFAFEAVRLGMPPALLYPTALFVGFVSFLWVYLTAARLARRTADTYVSASTLARRFAPPLLAIAAGYHVAHFLGYFLQLSPALVSSLVAPFETGDPLTLVLPDWFGLVAIAGVLGGHLLAIAAAHAVAFELFPGRLQALRSQYPFIVAMVFYTMVSLWVVTQPDATPPYI